MFRGNGIRHRCKITKALKNFKNNFFDVEIQCAENEMKDIGVMLTQNPQRSEAMFQMFQQKKNSDTPIKITKNG